MYQDSVAVVDRLCSDMLMHMVGSEEWFEHLLVKCLTGGVPICGSWQVLVCL